MLGTVIVVMVMDTIDYGISDSVTLGFMTF
jgi:hypothetical protein